MANKESTVPTSSHKETAKKRGKALTPATAAPALQGQASTPAVPQALADPRRMVPADVLALQRQIGNQAVQRLFDRHAIQAKHTAGAAHDAVEQEAALPAAAPVQSAGEELPQPPITSQPSSVVQRAVAQDTWNAKIEPMISTTDWPVFTTDENPELRKLVRRQKNGFGVIDSAAKKWAPLGDLPAFLQAHTWTEKFRNQGDTIDFASAPVLNSTDLTNDTVPMNVQELEGDRHSFVHYSYSTYQIPGKAKGKGKAPPPQRREAGHHLTVENAHLLAMLVADAEKTLAPESLDKTKLDKPGVNTQLQARNVTELDNLNFFPKRDSQTAKPLGLKEEQLKTAQLPVGEDPAKEDVDPRLSLGQYLTFIQTALESIPTLSPLYGAKILYTAQKMGELTGLDPAQMFLKVGKGDQRQLLRAVLSMDKNNLAPGLVIPPAVRAIFERYVTAKSALPLTTPVGEDTEWVAKGALSKDTQTHYNQLEEKYVSEHYPAVTDAVKAYIA